MTGTDEILLARYEAALDALTDHCYSQEPAEPVQEPEPAPEAPRHLHLVT